MNVHRPNSLLEHRLVLPLLGISLFLLLFLLAASLYPGGSDNDRISKGFSLINNYWCDLMGKWAKNGMPNPAQPIAITAWIILCFSLCLFWVFLPRLFLYTNINHKIIQFAGVCSSLTGLFIFTEAHDRIINISAFFGAIAMIAMVLELKTGKLYDLFGLGVLCFVLALINYIMFATNLLVAKMPVIQKIAFVFCLLMFGLIDFRIYQKERRALKLGSI